MILYYSGTGNSRYVASILSSQIGDELISMNDIMRERIINPYSARYAFQSESPLVFVCPTYCWQIPRVVEQFILDSRFEGCRDAYFYLTCGDGTGSAAKYAQELCKKAELNYMGLSSVKMPENYITMFQAPSYDEAQGIIRAAVSQTESTGRFIAMSKPIADPNEGSGIMTHLSKLNPYFYKLFVNDKKFYAKEDCTGCGACTALCPLANITLEDGRPVWHGNCTQCMACIGSCPQNAIEYGKKSLNKRRYYLYGGGIQRKDKS